VEGRGDDRTTNQQIRRSRPARRYPELRTASFKWRPRRAEAERIQPGEQIFATLDRAVREPRRTWKRQGHDCSRRSSRNATRSPAPSGARASATFCGLLMSPTRQEEAIAIVRRRLRSRDGTRPRPGRRPRAFTTIGWAQARVAQRTSRPLGAVAPPTWDDQGGRKPPIMSSLRRGAELPCGPRHATRQAPSWSRRGR